MGGALAEIRILEVGEGKALTYAGRLLRDLACEVIKVAPPARRDSPFRPRLSMSCLAWNMMAARNLFL